MDDPDYLSAIQDKLQFRMPVVMANFEAGSNNDLSGECPGVNHSHGNAVMSNMRWTSKDALDNENNSDEEGELVIGDVAESLEQCGDDSCSACHKAHWSNAPSNEFYTCTDYTQYKYSNLCTARQNQDKCGEDDICFRSWPHDDPNKWKSEDFPADLFPCASKLVTSSTLGDLADPTRVSAPSAVVMALATTPGLSTMPTAGSPLTLCADARTEKAQVSHSETTPNWQPRCHKLPTST